MPSPLRYGRRLSDARHSQSLCGDDHEWHPGTPLTQRFQSATTVGEDVAGVNHWKPASSRAPQHRIPGARRVRVRGVVLGIVSS